MSVRTERSREVIGVRCCSDGVAKRVTASGGNIAMDSWHMDVALSSDKLQTQTI